MKALLLHRVGGIESANILMARMHNFSTPDTLPMQQGYQNWFCIVKYCILKILAFSMFKFISLCIAFLTILL